VTREARLTIGAIVATAGVLAAAFADAQRLRPRDVDTLPSRPADARVAYGTDPLQFGDLRLPKGTGPFPVVIVIHGGCWVSRFATLQNTAAFSDALRDAGVATWNIEYRRTDTKGGGWPGTFTDVADAADHVRALAKQYPLDLAHVVVAGHSAGGHLALWTAARARVPRDSDLFRESPLPVVGAVALGGPGDLRDFTTYAQDVCGGPVVEQLMGGTPAGVGARYAHGSPAELLPIGIRQVLIVGAQDGIMPERARDAYVARARKAGDKVDAIVVPDAGHFEVIAPTSAAFPVVRDSILEMAGIAMRTPKPQLSNFQMVELPRSGR
jgi:acetyl esterase/lipase